MDENDEFSVWWWDREGNQHCEMRGATAENAVRSAHRLSEGPASKALGIVDRVIITDGEDFTNFEWIKGRGVTFK
jgi:hypothetical protein